jgi:hypothetical protein
MHHNCNCAACATWHNSREPGCDCLHVIEGCLQDNRQLLLLVVVVMRMPWPHPLHKVLGTLLQQYMPRLQLCKSRNRVFHAQELTEEDCSTDRASEARCTAGAADCAVWGTLVRPCWWARGARPRWLGRVGA